MRLTLATAALLLAGIDLLPVLAMIGKSLYADGGFSLKAYQALLASGKQQASLMGHSLVLSFLTATLATVVGAAFGLLLGKTDLPLRRTFAVLLTLPLLLPPYLIAVAWFAVLGKGGWVAQALPRQISELVSSALFGLYGCIGVLFVAFMPIVMLLTITSLGAINPRWEEAGRVVSRWPSVLRRITMPVIAPAIIFAAAVVFLLTFGEVSVPTFFRYPVYPMEILTQFAAFYDAGAASAAAIPMLFFTLAILGLEHRLMQNRVLELTAMTQGRRAVQIELGRWRIPILGLVSGWALVTVAIPLLVLVTQSASRSAYVEAFSRAGDAVVRSLIFAMIGATMLMVLGFFCGYLIHNRTLRLWRSVDGLALFLFTLPGTVIGIGLVSLWNTPMTNAIYSTPAIIILGYLAQYTLLPMRITSGTLRGIPRSWEQVARLCGATWFMSLWHIVIPLAKRGLLAAWLIGYVFCLRDVGISIVVYPPGSDTLAIRILTLMANGAPNLIAALCVILIGATLVPLGLASLWLRHDTRYPGV
jgi:iron(III) transport system permease protein